MSPSRRTATRMQVHTPATEKPADQHTPSWDVVRSILARQDTLRAQALDECRHKEQQERSAEVEKRVIAANGLDTTWRDRCQAAEEKLNAVVDSLGGYGTISFRNGTHTQAGPEDIADLVALLRSHNSVKDARRALFGGWSEPLRVVDQALATLRTALVELDYATKPVNVSHDT